MEQNILRKRTRKPKVDERRFTTALNRVREYFDAGKTKEVQRAFQNRLGLTTIKGWLNNPTKAFFANQAHTLIDLIDQLPPLHDQRYAAYSFIMAELGFDRQHHIKQLSSINGRYQFFHKFDLPYANTMRTLIVSADSVAGIAGFIFRYRPEKSDARECDGFVFARNQRLFLIGLSKTSIFYATLKSTVDPNNDMTFGAAAFEEVYMQRVLLSNIVLVPPGRGHSTQDRDLIDEHLNKEIDFV